MKGNDAEIANNRSCTGMLAVGMPIGTVLGLGVAVGMAAMGMWYSRMALTRR